MSLHAKVNGAWQEVPDAEKVFVKVAGAWSLIGTDLPDYNDASGGTVTMYTRDGKWFRVHKFTESGDFVVNAVSAKPFRVLAVGGGTSGIHAGGNGGQVIDRDDVAFAVGTIPVVVGAASQSSSIGTVTAQAGPAPGDSQISGGDFPRYAGGSGNGGANPQDNGNGGAGVESDILGTPQRFGGGGGGGAWNNVPGTGTDGGGNGGNSSQGGNATPNTGGGGGGECLPPSNTADGTVGGSGLVAVSYEIEAPVFNDATGGTVTDVEDYLGNAGQTWRIHTFTAGDNLVVNAAPQPFRVFLNGAGGGGGGYDGNWHGNGGSGGFDTQDDAAVIPVGTHAVVIGNAGGWGGEGTGSWGATGGETKIGDLFTAAGGQGGAPPGVNNGNYGGGASNGGTTDIRGVSESFGNGGPPDCPPGYSPGTNTGNGGGGGHTGRGDPGGPRPGTGGSNGIAMVAYRIA